MWSDLLAGTGWSARWPRGCPSPGCRCLMGGRASQEQQSARWPTSRSALLSCTFHWRSSPLEAGGQKDQWGQQQCSLRWLNRHYIDKYTKILWFSHLAEAFFDGAEIWKNIIPHHSVFLPLHPDNRPHRTAVSSGTPHKTTFVFVFKLFEANLWFWLYK